MPLIQLLPLIDGLLPEEIRTAEEKCKVDIFAVHGLNPFGKREEDHALNTWTKPAGPTGNLWLRDNLKDLAPTARVFVYQYNSRLVWGGDKASFSDKADDFLEDILGERKKNPERPIIFVSHSLGGLLIEQALINAYNSKRYEIVKKSTAGLVFFGTPHGGGDRSLVNIGSGAAKVARYVGAQKNRDLEKTLQSGSLFTDIHQRLFKNQKLDHPIISFWEGDGEIVSKTSATYGLPDDKEVVIKINADHGDICRFDMKSTRDKENFKRVWNALEDMYNRALQQAINKQGDGRTIGGLSDSDLTKIMKWISNIQYPKHQKQIFNNALKDTGQWLLHSEAYLSWQQSSKSSILWVHGIPGSGKTTLMSIVINSLVTSEKPEFGRTAFFYAANTPGDPTRTNSEEILRSILRQISITESPSYISPVVLQAYSDRKSRAFADGSLDTSDCVELISGLTRQYDYTNIIVDGLDEIPDDGAHQLFDALEAILTNSQSIVRLLVSSRDRADIVSRLQRVPDVAISGTDNSKDIEKYATISVDRLIATGQLLGGTVSPELYDLIVQTLSVRAQGMFQWVRSSLHYLRFMNLEEDLRRELGRLPPELLDTYIPIYERIKSLQGKSKDLAHRCLCWLLCGERELSTKEFIAAVSVDSNATYMVTRTQDVIRVCQTFVLYDQELDVFRFAHLSVKEFLESNEDFQMELRNKIVAERCLIACLKTDAESAQVWGANEMLYQYATFYWALHCDLSKKGRSKNGLPSQGGPNNNQLHHLFKRFLLKEKAGSEDFRRCTEDARLFILEPLHFVDWMYDGMQRYWYAEQDIFTRILSCMWRSNSTPTPNFTAAIWDFREVFANSKRIQPMDLCQKNTRQQTCLILATLNQRKEVVAWLLQRYHTDPNFGTAVLAIHCSAWTGNLDILNLLLAADAKLNLTCADGKTALMIAVERSHTHIVQRLLEAGANHALINQQGNNALQLAITAGSFQCCSALLEHGADANAKDKSGLTSMHLAVATGSNRIVRRLLSLPLTQVDPDALMIAIHKGNLSLAKDILRHESFDANAFSGDWSALFWAAFHGSDEIVNVLLHDRNVDTDGKLLSFQWAKIDRLRIYHHGPVFQTWSFRTPRLPASITNLGGADLISDIGSSCAMLSTALLGSRLPVLQLLQNSSVPNPNEVDQFGRSPLWWAVSTGNTKLVERLVSWPQVDVNLTDSICSPPPVGNWGLPPLSLAVIGNKFEIAQMLLSRPDIDVNLGDAEDQTPIMHAARLGRSSLVVSLLRKLNPAHLNWTDLRWRRTPLAWAACGGHVESATHLLAKPQWSLNYSDISGFTAILYAAHSGQAQLVQKMLRDKRIDPYIRDNDGRTIVWIAAANGNLAIIEEVMNLEIEPRFRDEFLSLEDYQMRGPISAAAMHGHANIVRLLILSSSKPKLAIQKQDVDGKTPLLLAVEAGHIHVVKTIFDAQTPNHLLGTVDFTGRTPLSLAAQNGHSDIVYYLTDLPQLHGSSDEEFANTLWLNDHQERSALSWATEYGHVAIIRHLLDKKPSFINAKDAKGRTPLSWAVSGGHLAAVQLLLTYAECNVNDKDYKGHLPVWWATENGHILVADALCKQGLGDSNQEVKPSKPFIHWEPHQEPLRSQQTINYVVNDTGRTLLSEAAERGHVSIVQFCLKTWPQVEINRVDHDGHAPIWHAVQAGQKLIVWWFLCSKKLDQAGVDLVKKQKPEWFVENLVVKRFFRTYHPCVGYAVRQSDRFRRIEEDASASRYTLRFKGCH